MSYDHLDSTLARPAECGDLFAAALNDNDGRVNAKRRELKKPDPENRKLAKKVA